VDTAQTYKSGAVELAVADALELAPPQATALSSFGAAASVAAAEAVGSALGQPVSVGLATVRRVAPGEIESENWDLYHPVDVLWETAGAIFSALALVPRAELQTFLPAARGTADLPDMEALGTLLRGVAEYVGARLQLLVPITFSLADAQSAATTDPNESYIRVEHTILVGNPGAETHLTVVHLIPAAALQAVAARAPVPPEAVVLAQEVVTGYADIAGGADTHPPTATSLPGSGVAPGGETRIMEDPMASGPAAAHPAGTSVHPVQFQPFENEGEPQGGTNLDLLLDVSLRVSVELGRTDLAIKDVLALGPGSVVELDKLAGEPVDILVNDRLIAKGEVVVVDENFGVRVTDIVSPQKRIGKMR
jgi:flagellar motor switch protein FliN